MKAHEIEVNLTLELRKQSTLKFRYFSMKAHEKYLNLISELGRERTFKVRNFS